MITTTTTTTTTTTFEAQCDVETELRNRKGEYDINGFVLGLGPRQSSLLRHFMIPVGIRGDTGALVGTRGASVLSPASLVASCLR
jgi:hypothetical protein